MSEHVFSFERMNEAALFVVGSLTTVIAYNNLLLQLPPCLVVSWMVMRARKVACKESSWDT
jgi:hypothetical protein